MEASIAELREQTENRATEIMDAQDKGDQVLKDELAGTKESLEAAQTGAVDSLKEELTEKIDQLQQSTADELNSRASAIEEALDAAKDELTKEVQ